MKSDGMGQKGFNKIIFTGGNRGGEQMRLDETNIIVTGAGQGIGKVPCF